MFFGILVSATAAEVGVFAGRLAGVPGVASVLPPRVAATAVPSTFRCVGGPDRF
jgi:hypothetical protein